MKSAHFFNVLPKGNRTPASASARAEESSRGFPRQVIPGEKWGRRRGRRTALRHQRPRWKRQEARSRENITGGQEPWSGSADVRCACLQSVSRTRTRPDPEKGAELSTSACERGNKPQPQKMCLKLRYTGQTIGKKWPTLQSQEVTPLRLHPCRNRDGDLLGQSEFRLCGRQKVDRGHDLASLLATPTSLPHSRKSRRAPCETAQQRCETIYLIIYAISHT